MHRELGVMKAVVTGGTAGIGAHIAANLVAAGYDVTVTARHHRPVSGATFVQVDHSLIAANKAFAAAAGPIDLLVNNVGGNLRAERTVTPEGHELGLALNYLGPVALTKAITFSPGATVVNIVSSSYSMFHGDPFVEPEAYVGIQAHARAKQLNLLATMSFARHHDGAVNAVNPGMAWTPGIEAMPRGAVPAWRYIWPLVRFMQRRASPAKAAKAPTEWALHPRGTGNYVESDGRPRKLPERLTDPELQDRAWNWQGTAS
jgi:NAD(P)-dependent dehydrogenase (short-subunit alcohol dehydrogenase family)